MCSDSKQIGSSEGHCSYSVFMPRQCVSILQEPVIGEAVNAVALNQYKNDRELYDKTACLWSQEFAGGKYTVIGKQKVKCFVLQECNHSYILVENSILRLPLECSSWLVVCSRACSMFCSCSSKWKIRILVQKVPFALTPESFPTDAVQCVCYFKTSIA